MKQYTIIFICVIGLFVNNLHAQFTIKEGNDAVYLFLTVETPGNVKHFFRVFRSKSV